MEYEYNNCKKCGRLFQVTYCDDCVKNGGESDLDIVKDFISKHHGQNLFDVANATGVKKSKILNYINSGSLTIEDSSNITQGMDNKMKRHSFSKSIYDPKEKASAGAFKGRNQK